MPRAAVRMKSDVELAWMALPFQGFTTCACGCGRRGCVVDFLGRPASCHKALALFALLNRCPMLVVSCHRTDRPPRIANSTLARPSTAQPISMGTTTAALSGGSGTEKPQSRSSGTIFTGDMVT